MVAQDVARVGGKAQDGSVAARPGGEALSQRLGQVGLDRHIRFDQRMTLGVDGAGGVTLAVADLVGNILHRRGDVVERLLFIGLNGFHRIRVGNEIFAHGFADSSLVGTVDGDDFPGPFRSMRKLESSVGNTRRSIRIFLVLGASLAVASAGLGALLWILGRTRPDVTLTFAEFGLYVGGLGVLHLVLYAGLFWQVSRLSRRPRLPSADAPAEST